jgi:hypothetical protein
LCWRIGHCDSPESPAGPRFVLAREVQG